MQFQLHAKNLIILDTITESFYYIYIQVRKEAEWVNYNTGQSYTYKGYYGVYSHIKPLMASSFALCPISLLVIYYYRRSIKIFIG